MRSLFLRIFLWFWLAMAILVALQVALSPYWTRSHPGLANWEGTSVERMEEELDGIAVEMKAGHLPRRGPGQGERRGRRGGHLFVLDADGRQVAGGPPPSPEVRELAAETRLRGEPVSQRDGLMFLVARQATGPSGEDLVLVLAGPGPRRPPRPFEVLGAREMVPRLLAVVAVVGALCWWLSRWLTSPLRDLQGAARRLGRGDLQARVGGRVGRRRDELGELAREFNGMAERVERLVGSHRQLLQDVSHELRSPLARLGVALELARRTAGSTASRDLDRVEQEASRLDGLIGRLLVVARLEGGDDPEPVTTLDADALVAAIVEDGAFEAAGRGVSVTATRLDPCRVEGRRELLRSAIENVVRNAVRFTADGTDVEVALAAGEGECHLEIRDRGPGVTEEMLDRIFDPFVRAETARDREHGGTGLGLAIASRAVALHGGRISAHNQPDGGLVVAIDLPTLN